MVLINNNHENKIIYTNSRKEYDLWKQINEDDDTIDKIEDKLSYILLFISVNTILGYFFFGMGTMLLLLYNVNGGFSIIKVTCFSIRFLLRMVSSILIRRKIVNLEKEIPTLVKGSVYDTKLARKLLDSCDEAIVLEI